MRKTRPGGDCFHDGRLNGRVVFFCQADWICTGYKFTVLSSREEEMAKGLLSGGEMKFYPQGALTRQETNSVRPKPRSS
ncbi:hypothetical protein J2Z75_000883 [Rhizobium herbae]|uniref:Uncharacterized protein n=1 Tax=Rhizobium herbae TaxID=508661 RepID=A0ABS4EHI0_9HYPH|nr:hypothetical protein [Rhizobium herbae]